MTLHPLAMSKSHKPLINKATPSPPRQRRRGSGKGRRAAGTMFTSTGATQHATTRMPRKIVRSIESPCSFKSSHIRLQLRVEHWSTVSWRHQKEDVLFEISKKMRGQLLAVAMAASYPHPSLQNHKKSIYDNLSSQFL